MSEVLVNSPNDCAKKLFHLEFCLKSLTRKTKGPTISIEERDSFLRYVNYFQHPTLACQREIVMDERNEQFQIICKTAGQCIRTEMS